MQFQSPTATVSVPTDAKSCTSPEQCVLFALSEGARVRNKKLKASTKKSHLHRNRQQHSKGNEIFTAKELLQAVGNAFPKRSVEGAWVDEALEGLVARGAIVNVNAGCDNMAPAYKLTVATPQLTASSQILAHQGSKKVPAAPVEAARKKKTIEKKIKKLCAVKKVIRRRK